MNFTVTLVGLFSCLVSFGQSREEIDAYFTARRNKQSASSLSFDTKKEKVSIDVIAGYLNDSLPGTIRSEAYFLLSTLGARTENGAVRKDVVILLIQGWRDSDPGIQNQVESSLIHFKPTDFNRAAIDTLKILIKKLPSNPGKLFKLVGYLRLQDQLPLIESYLKQQPSLRNHDRWLGYVALARMGDQPALDMILNRVYTFGINNDVVHELFPDLVYTRTYRAIHYLEEILFSNGKDCNSSNPESSQKVNCAYRVMELLAPVIKDFPIATDVNGGLAVHDYEDALEKVRSWFKSSEGKYEIIQDTY